MSDDMETGPDLPEEPLDETTAYAPLDEEPEEAGPPLSGRGIPFANVLGPFIVWMLKRETYPFVDEEGKEAVNFQLTMFIGMVVGYVLTLVFIGWLILLAVVVVDLIFVLIASMKANEGESYRYPLTFRFIQ